MPDFARAKTFLKEFSAALRSGVWYLSGTEAASGEPLKILFAGSEKQKAHLADIAFSGECTQHSRGKLYFWRILYLLHGNRSGCDIAIIEGNHVHRSLYKKSGDFFLPIWLKTSVAIPLLVTSHSYKEDIRRIRKSGLGYEITGDNDKIDDFYHNMYRPAVNASHGESTIEIGYDNMRRLLDQDKCVLLLVIKEGVSIAGALVILGHLPRIWAIGVRDNDPEYRKCSANTATYHFASRYLTDKGYSAMHMGMSRSFLNDGILQYKNKFDQHIIGSDPSGFVFKILRATAGTDGFLINNPFVYLSGEKLFGAAFIDRNRQPSAKDFERLRKKYFLAGLSGLEVFLQGSSAGDFHKIMEY